MYEPGALFFFFTSSVSWDTLTTFASHNLLVSYDVLARDAPLNAPAFSSAYLGTSGRGHSGG